MISIIIFSLVLVITLMQFLLFDVNIILTVLSLLFGVTGIVLCIIRLLPKVKKLPKAFQYLISIVLFLATGTSMSFASKEGMGLGDYNSSIEKVTALLKKGEFDDALEILSAMEENYGKDENTVLVRVLYKLKDQDLEGAYQELDELKDHTSYEYYSLEEMICLRDGSEEANEKLSEMYPEAAANWPVWTYMQKMAGVAKISTGEYKAAEYFLSRALMQDTTDPDVYYYLGVVSYHKNDRDGMKTYFDKAKNLNLSDEKKEHIKWYEDQNSSPETEEVG